jgi:hypothetical protein
MMRVRFPSAALFDPVAELKGCAAKPMQIQPDEQFLR